MMSTVALVLVALWVVAMAYLAVCLVCIRSAKRILDTARGALDRNQLDEWDRLFAKSCRRSRIAFPEEWFHSGGRAS